MLSPVSNSSPSTGGSPSSYREQGCVSRYSSTTPLVPPIPHVTYLTLTYPYVGSSILSVTLSYAVKATAILKSV